MKIIFSILQILFLLKFAIQKPIKIHFNKKPTHSKSDFFLYERDYEIFTDISIGTPQNIVSIKLTMEYSPFVIKGTNLQGKYNEKQSSTFISKSYPFEFYLQLFKEGYYSYDKIQINTLNDKSSNENLTFILATKEELHRKIPNDGIMGLKVEDTSNVREQGIIYQLKKQNITDNYAFTIDFKNDDEGDIIIGNYPHEYDKNYKEDFLYVAHKGDSNHYWKFSFSSIQWNNMSFNDVTDVKIFLDYGTIFGTTQYRNEVEKNFFNINNCEKNYYQKDSHIYFHCPSNTDISKFPPIIFSCKDLNSTFTFDYNELFVKEGDKYYFKIFFGDYKSDYWVIGKMFLKKYKIIFDVDKKLIAYYAENPTKTIGYKFLIWFIVLILLIIIIGLGYLIYKKFYILRRRKRANEIYDEYDYNPQINSETKDVIGINQ